MDDFKQQNWGGMNNPGQGQGGPSMPPPPPPPEITLRTMQSDLESVKQSGGENPVPQAFTPPEVKKQSTIGLEDLSQEEGMIKPGVGEGVLPPAGAPKKKGKIILLITILLLVIAGAAYAGYVYIYPIFAKPAISGNVLPPETIPPAPLPTPIPEIPTTVVTTPEVATSTEMATTTPEIATTTPELPPSPVLKSHVSLLLTPADSSVSLVVSGTTTLASVRDLLISESNNKPVAETSLKEVPLSNEGGQLVFGDTLSMFLPELSVTELNQLFQDDFTSVIFYDKNGAWFGLIAKLKEGADPLIAKTTMAKLENSDSLVNLYIQNPGTKSVGGFKDGKANNLVTRYISFSKTGASLNYGWTNDNLFVLSTSYNGIKAMLTKLGIQ